MTLMLTSVVAELRQSLLQVVVSELAAQLVWRLVEYPVWLVRIVIAVFFCDEEIESGHNTHFRVGGVWDLFILGW